MEKQVTNNETWWAVETTQGTMFLPTDLVRQEPVPEDASAFQDYCEGQVQSWELIQGYGARMSAPGYMDCTEWSVFGTREEAGDETDETEGEEDNARH
jgi:hypothetical protein